MHAEINSAVDCRIFCILSICVDQTSCASICALFISIFCSLVALSAFQLIVIEIMDMIADIITEITVAVVEDIFMLFSFVINGLYEWLQKNVSKYKYCTAVFLFAKPLFNETYMLSNAKISSWYVGVYSFSDILYNRKMNIPII